MTPRRYHMAKRDVARAEIRRRIVEATMALHLEQGIRATRWEDIARRADVAVATVYRHYPTLDELVTACGARVHAAIRPPDPAAAPQLFAGVPSLSDRLALLVHEMFAFYARAGIAFETVLREGHQLPAVAAHGAQLREIHEQIVREALRPLDPDEHRVQLITGLTDFLVWKSLADRGVAQETMADEVSKLLMCAIQGSQTGNVSA